MKCFSCKYYKPIAGLSGGKMGCHREYERNLETNCNDIKPCTKERALECDGYYPIDGTDMSFKQFACYAARTMDRRQSRMERTVHAVTGLCSEAGEVASIIQHALQENGTMLVNNDENARRKLIDEMGDMLWFMAELAAAADIRYEEIAPANVVKLYKRYPEGFNVKRSVSRHKLGED